LSPASVAQALAEHQQACAARARPLFDEALARARSAGVPASKVLTVDEAPLGAVQRLTQERHCLMVVVGSHGRGAVARALHGSLVADLVRHSSVPVLVCRADMDLDAALKPPDQPA
jgi:nucleotide-binding universal stress UspA family protein